MKKLLFLLLLTFHFSLFAASALAEVDASTKVVDTVVNREVDYTEANLRFSQIETAVKSGGLTSSELDKYLHDLVEIQNKISADKERLEKEQSFVQRKIEALPEAPTTGKELEVISTSRKQFNAEADHLKNKVAEAEISLAKIDELNNQISQARNRVLFSGLLGEQITIANPVVFINSSGLFVDFVLDIIKSPLNWYQDLTAAQEKLVKSKIVPVNLIILFAFCLGFYLRVLIMRSFGYRKDIENPNYSTRVIAAFCVAVAHGVIPAAIIIAFIFWKHGIPIANSGFFGLVLNDSLYFLLYVFLAKALARVTFAPYNEKWRLVKVENEKAVKLYHAFYLSIVAIGVLAFLQHIARQSNYSLELLYFLSALSSFTKAFCIILIVKRFTHKPLPPIAPEEDVEVDEEKEELEPLSAGFKITFLITLLASGVFLLSVFGYPNLSAFIFNRIITSVLFIGTLLILRKTLNGILYRLLLFRGWSNTFRMRHKLIFKIRFWFSILTDPIILCFALFVLLKIWGLPTELFIQGIKQAFMGFTVGGIKISLFSIVMALGVFLVSLAVVKLIRSRLLMNVLDKMEVEESIKHSLDSGFGFLGFIIALLLAIAVLGGNLTNLALIAGALSFGIGLGLQNIVNNFVSGLILLFERPIKVGDWVIVNGHEGIVKQINIRATELMTWKKASVIIPNADILSTSLINMTHDDRWGRVDIKVGVAYGTDVNYVMSMLNEIAESNKKVLKKPAPYTVFMNFGDSSLDFELRCYTADVMNSLTISSDLRVEINKRFMEEGIEIPFPQRVVHNVSQNTRFLDQMVNAPKSKKK